MENFRNKQELNQALNRYCFQGMLKSNIILTSQINHYCNKIDELTKAAKYSLAAIRLNLGCGETVGVSGLIDRLLNLCKPKFKNKFNFEFAKFLLGQEEALLEKLEELNEVCEGAEWMELKKNCLNLSYALHVAKTIMKNVYGLRYTGKPGINSLVFLDGEPIYDPETFQPSERYTKFLLSLPRSTSNRMSLVYPE